METANPLAVLGGLAALHTLKSDSEDWVVFVLFLALSYDAYISSKGSTSVALGHVGAYAAVGLAVQVSRKQSPVAVLLGTVTGVGLAHLHKASPLST